MPCPVITVQTATTGPREVPTKWSGHWLAVHRPLRRDGLSTEPGLWTVTLHPLGLSCGEVDAPLRAVVAFARLWDAAAARWDDVTAAADASTWRWRDRFRDDVHRVRSGRPPIGPRALTPIERLESAGTAAECEAAVRAAMGAPTPEPDDHRGQWPAPVTRKTTGAGAVRIGPDGLLEYWWLPRGGNYPESQALSLAGWYEVPQADNLDDQCLGSVALTPCQDPVEPDHPDAWPRLLGLI